MVNAFPKNDSPGLSLREVFVEPPLAVSYELGRFTNRPQNW